MKKQTILKNYLYILLPIVALIIASGLFLYHVKTKEKPYDGTGFTQDKILVVALEENSVDYFIYKGFPMGYQLELLQRFADYAGVKLLIKTDKSLEKQIQRLLNNEVDLIASNFTISAEREAYLAFSTPLYYTEQVLVQRKSPKEKLVTKWSDLKGKTVYVRKGSVFEQSLHALKAKNPKIYDFEIVTDADKTEENFLWELARGHIDYTVTSKNRAKRYARSHPKLDYSLELTKAQPIAWALPKAADTLIFTVNQWLETFSKTDTFAYLYHKYYDLPNVKVTRFIEAGIEKMDSLSAARSKSMQKNATLKKEGKDAPSSSTKAIAKDAVSATDNSAVADKEAEKEGVVVKRTHRVQRNIILDDNTISPFDVLLKKHSQTIGWDWRLLASLIYQESQFRSHLVSKAGATGLMQMMPATAKRYHITASSSVEKQIEAGVAYLRLLDKSLPLEIPAEERYQFVLAGYNMGMGHVMDAMRLAKKYGDDPNRWENHVAKYLLLKSQPKYYRDPVVKHGSAKGKATTAFIKEIEERFGHYQNLIPE
ncbi:MAG: transporter substrate-binding domain-containing protein [Bacteroidales bacterium]